jgi:hypothetical protein
MTLGRTRLFMIDLFPKKMTGAEVVPWFSSMQLRDDSGLP